MQIQYQSHKLYCRNIIKETGEQTSQLRDNYNLNKRNKKGQEK